VWSGLANTASGLESNIAGGRNNISSGIRSSIGGGDQNTASGDYARIGGGQLNQSTGQYAGIGAGSSNQSTAQGSWVGGGTGNISKGIYSWISGGKEATAPYYGSAAKSSGRFSIQGDNQEIWTQLMVTTTNATPTNMLLGDGTAGITIPTDSSAFIKATILGVQTNALVGFVGDTYAQEIELLVKNIAGVLTVDTAYQDAVANLQSKTTNVIYKIAYGTLSAATSVAASVAGVKVYITPTGALNRTIQWSADVQIKWLGYRNFSV
jgi:hypothetical protein